MSLHVPVLLNESLDFLITNKSGNYFDGTIGYGGHASEILKLLNDDASLIATDKDVKAFEYCKEKFKNESRLKLFNTDFTDIKRVSMIEFVNEFDGIFADLGVSSAQLDDKSLGFTYREDAPLDLRMNKSQGESAAHVVNNYSEEQLSDILKSYGELRQARKLARKIIEARRKHKIVTTFQLREIVETIVPEYKSFKTLSQVFQAFRIYVNKEIDRLKEFLEKSIESLKIGGRIVIISYHSLEDRIVKDFFKYESLSCICPPEAPICTCDKEVRLKILTRKPIIATQREIATNRRARSAKLRAAERV